MKYKQNTDYKQNTEQKHLVAHKPRLRVKTDKKEKVINLALAILLMLTASIIVELVVFNYRHWGSVRNQERGVKNMTLGGAFLDNGDGTYTIGEGDTSIEITDINQVLSTSCIAISVQNRSEDEQVPVILNQAVTDESHEMYYGLPTREIWEAEARSTYMTYHLYGKCRSLRITPELTQGQTVSLSIRLNPVIPMFISWERILFLFGILLILYAFRPASSLYQTNYFSLSKGVKIAIPAGIFLINVVVFYMLNNVNPIFQTERGDLQNHYQQLAEAFHEGSLSLLVDPPQALKDMENPYDFEYRQEIMNQSGGEWFLWDRSYFNQKYYVYFGVVPEVLFFYPYYVLTGNHIHNHTVIFISSILFLIGILGVLTEAAKKWFPDISVGLLLLSTELLLAGCGIVYMVKRPDLYTIPIILGLAFALFGLWFILLATRTEKISIPYLLAGSLCTALVAGCRPQLFVFIAFSIILLKPYLFSKEKLFQKEWVKTIATYAIPMIVVAVLLMLYNDNRFGSPFDFGANYNLTFNDMRRRGFQLDRIPLGIFAYLFQPLKLIQDFPFTEAVFFNSQYMGVTIQEATYGGLLMVCPFAWFACLSVPLRKHVDKSRREAHAIAVAALLTALLVIVVDTEMAGILIRYFCDFRLLFMISSILSLWLLMEHPKIKGNTLSRMLLWALLFCLCAEIVYQGMIFFLDTGEALRESRPDLYSHIKYLVTFWL